MNTDDLIELCHEQAHNAPHDFEDTLVMALTRRDCWLLAFTLLVVSEDLESGCDLNVQADDLRVRLAELIDCQKDHWKA